MIRFSVLLLSTLLSVSINSHAITLSATQDAFTQDNKPNNNFGGALRLKVSDGPIKIGFIEFDVSSLTGTIIDDVQLKLVLTNVVDGGNISLKEVNGNWSEDTITHNNKPGIGSEILNFALSSGNEGTIISIDVTDTVKAWVDGTSTNYGLSLSTGNANVKFGTKEDGNAPLLEVSEGVNPTGTRVYVPGDYATLQEAFNGIEKTWCPDKQSNCEIILGAGVFEGGDINVYAGYLKIYGSGIGVTVIESLRTGDESYTELVNMTIKDVLRDGNNSEIKLYNVDASLVNDIVLDESNLYATGAYLGVVFTNDGSLYLMNSSARRIITDTNGWASVKSSKVEQVDAWEGAIEVIDSDIDNFDCDNARADIVNSYFASDVYMFECFIRVGNSRVGGSFIDNGSNSSRCASVINGDFLFFRRDCRVLLTD